MKRFILLSAAILGIAANSSARTEDESKTSRVSYSLPSTTLNFTVTARKEVFKAGPFAKYGKKYLGFSPRQSDEIKYEISRVSVRSVTEADMKARYTVNLPESGRPEFLQISSQGLIVGDMKVTGKSAGWRFPLTEEGGFSGMSMPANLAKESGTQTIFIAKPTEEKAKEIAEKIFQIRENRYKILVGDTDATYSGEALKAAADALEKMEKEYLALFTGKSTFSTVKGEFEVVPTAADSLQQYVAFRVSDTEGLVAADNFSGRPYYLNLSVESILAPEKPQGRQKPSNSVTDMLHYRIPAICTATLTDGMSTILQTRIPVYQLGIEEKMPVR